MNRAFVSNISFYQYLLYIRQREPFSNCDMLRYNATVLGFRCARGSEKIVSRNGEADVGETFPGSRFIQAEEICEIAHKCVVLLFLYSLRVRYNY